LKSRPGTRQWYPWDPTEIPYISRLTFRARGILDFMREAYFLTGEVPSKDSLMLKDDELEDYGLALKVWPAVKVILDREMSHADQISNINRINGASGGRSAVAKRSVSEIKHTDIDTNKNIKDKEKEPTSRKRSVMPPKVKNPTEPNMEELYGVLAEVVQMVSPGEDWDHARAKKAYWTIVGNWHPTKNPKPKGVLLGIIESVRAGTNIQDIAWGAEAYRDENINKPQFMVMLAEWIKNEGWNPYTRSSNG